mgnify:CR=1 FL=1|jgi:hypothetical protein
MKDNTSQTSNYTCNDYRAEMILLGLQRQIAQQDLTSEEKEALLRRIEEMEKEMGMDSAE